MKHLVVLIAAGLVAIAIYAVAAPAGEQAVTPKQFAALSKKVTTLQKDVKVLKAEASCALVQAVPIGQFGKPSGNEGYVYNEPNNDLALTTALDVTSAGSAQAWVLVTSAECANIINSGKKKPVAAFRVHATR